MQLKPVHKIALAGTVVALLAGLLVYIGFAWGTASGRGEERLLSVKMNEDALERMSETDAAEEDEAEDENAHASAAELQRMSKVRYIRWLEQQLDKGAASVARLEKQAGQVALSTSQYAEFARMVVTASRPAAQADNLRRPLVSKVSVQVLSDYWRETHGVALNLPDDLFDRAMEGTTAATSCTARPTPLPAPPVSSPGRGKAGTGALGAGASASGLSEKVPSETATAAQLASIRAAIAQFNRQE